MLRAFWDRFWMPPRRHGELLHDRRVSPMELFYDLVFVVVVARAAHGLAHHVTWHGVGVFAVVFCMVWIAWFNGSMYYELHGREDGRTRTFVFTDMTLLAILAVFTEEAGGEASREFAAVYAVLLLVMTGYWWGVQRRDEPQFRAQARRYIVVLFAGALLIGASVLVPGEARVWVWAVFAVAWMSLTMHSFTRERDPSTVAMVPTESMVERFDLFTILVLGEVVAGVVAGLSGAESSGAAIVAAVFGMILGFSMWWIYFDLVGRRVPPAKAWRFGSWMGIHLPVAGAIAAAGAGVVSLVEHADAGHTPHATAWLLAGAMSLFLLSVVGLSKVLAVSVVDVAGYRAVALTLLLAAMAVLAVGALAPVAWLLVLLMVVIASVGWVIAAVRSVAFGTAPSPDGR